MEQLEFLELTEEMDILQQVRKLEQQHNNLRRGIFGRFDKLLTKTVSLEEKLDIIMKHLEMSDAEIMGKKILELPLFEWKAV